jgi:iron(III) transport system substrate-binding protein
MKTSIPQSLALGAVCALGLVACGGSPAASPSAGPSSPVDVGAASAVTPVDAATIAAAEKEGSVLLYTNADEQLMKPVAAAFKAKYPGIQLRVLDLGDAQILQRYATETATGVRSADVVMTSDALGMLDFVKRGNVENYTDPNVKNLPKYAQLAPGVVAMSEDPVVAVFNKALLPEAKQPKDMASLAALSGSIKGKVATTDISNPVQFSAMSAYIGKNGDSGWQIIEKLGPNSGVRHRQPDAEARAGAVPSVVLRLRCGPGAHHGRCREGPQLRIPPGRYAVDPAGRGGHQEGRFT